MQNENQMALQSVFDAPSKDGSKVATEPFYAAWHKLMSGVFVFEAHNMQQSQRSSFFSWFKHVEASFFEHFRHFQRDLMELLSASL